MKRFTVFFLCLFSFISTASAQSSSPCYWFGDLAKCFPSTGLFLDNSRTLRLGTDNATNYVELRADTGMSSNYTVTFPAALGSSGQVLYDTDGLGSLGWRDAGVSQTALNSATAILGNKQPVDLVCESNVTLSGIQTCDGQPTSSASRILAVNQSDPTEMGIWVVDDFLPWVRPTDFVDISANAGALVTVKEIGTTYWDSLWFGLGDGSTQASWQLIPMTDQINQLPDSKAVVTNSNHALAFSDTTATEIGYVSGVTSAIQTQLNSKVAGPTVAIGNGGTGQTTKAAAFDALSPMSAANDIIYGGTGGTGTLLHSSGFTTDILHAGSGGTPPSWGAVKLTTDVTGTLGTAQGGTGITGFGTGIATWLGTPSSANLRSALTDETGTGAAVFATRPTITLQDNTTTFQDDGDNTKQLQFQLAGLSSPATRTATWPDASITVVGTDNIATLTNKTINGSSNTITNLSLTAGVTGTLPLANGGTNKNMTASSGGIVWTDSDSQEVTSAGTASQWVLSGGTATPTMSNTTTTGKFVDGSADEIQMRIQAHSTQTSNIITVEKSDSTVLFDVTNASGTFIKGTTDASSIATGDRGEYYQDAWSGSYSASQSNTVMATRSLSAGIWLITASGDYNAGSGAAWSSMAINFNCPTYIGNDGKDYVGSTEAIAATQTRSTGSMTVVINSSGSTTCETRFTGTRTSGVLAPDGFTTYLRIH